MIKVLKNSIVAIWAVFIIIIIFIIISIIMDNPISFTELPIQYFIVIPPMFFAVYMLFAFSIHFLQSAHRIKQLDSVLFEIKKPIALYFFVFFFLLIAISAGYYFILNNEMLPEKFHFVNIDGLVKAIVILFFFIMQFLLIVAVRLIWYRPSFFVFTENGFVYEPGSISPGLILWADIESINELELAYAPSSEEIGKGTATFLVMPNFAPSLFYSCLWPTFTFFPLKP
jgi:hypothetical protein